MKRNQSDTAWKKILDRYLKDFFDYCLPELSAKIGWERPPVQLDKELEALTKGNDTGKRLLDKLFKVYFKDGQEQWILIHIEIQGQPDEYFPQRMFTYAYRTFDKYQKPIVSCAILTDGCKTWRPNCFEIGAGGCSLGLKFLTIKLLDYKDAEAELDASDNIFATVILTQLKTLEIRSKPDVLRKDMKFSLTKRLLEKNLAKTKVADLYAFLDWSIGLPEALEIEYNNAVIELEGTNMTYYVSSMERRSFKRGKEEGKAEGKLEVAERLLRAGVSLSIIEESIGCSLAELNALKSKKEVDGSHLVVSA